MIVALLEAILGVQVRLQDLIPDLLCPILPSRRHELHLLCRHFIFLHNCGPRLVCIETYRA